MTEEEKLEKETEELFNKKPLGYAMNPELEIYADGFKEGYNKAMKEWRDCFMSCSSPYCADKFRDIQCGGILGNMTKEGKENDPDKLTDDVMNDWKEMEDVENDSSL